MEEEFNGHEAYSEAWYRDVSWINPIQIGTKREDINDQEWVSAYSMHPNEKGAQAYARCVNAKIEELENRKNTYNKTLSGVITIADTDTDMTNNLPLEGAQITLTRIGLLGPILSSATSGSDGRYTVKNLASGTYVIMVTKEGYIPVSGTITIAEDVENYYNAAVEAISLDYGGNGTASGKVYDVLTGRGISGLTLNIRKGINVTTGDIEATIETNTDGSYTTPALPAGNYSVEIVDKRVLDDEDTRYLTSVFIIKILGDHSIPNQDGYATNGLKADQLRIVLKWGENPRDLDSHLVGPAGDSGRFHVYYSNKNYNAGSKLMVNLDLDDTSSYGPETTTIYEMIPGVYTFMIHDYTNKSQSSSTALSNSGAYVEVYLGASTSAAYTFNVPSGDGTLWTVFSYNSNTGKITPINTLSYHGDAGSVGSSYQVREIAAFSLPENLGTAAVAAPLKDYEIQELLELEQQESNESDTDDSYDGDDGDDVQSEDDIDNINDEDAVNDSAEADSPIDSSVLIN